MDTHTHYSTVVCETRVETAKVKNSIEKYVISCSNSPRTIFDRYYPFIISILLYYNDITCTEPINRIVHLAPFNCNTFVKELFPRPPNYRHCNGMRSAKSAVKCFIFDRISFRYCNRFSF